MRELLVRFGGGLVLVASSELKPGPQEDSEHDQLYGDSHQVDVRARCAAVQVAEDWTDNL